MAQDGNTSGGNSYTLDNVTFPIGRNKLQSIFDAIRSTNKGSSAPNLVAGQFWVDDSAGTTWVLYFYDGSNSIQFATIDTSANTINFTDSALDLVTDTSPQLGGDLASNGNAILFADNDIANFGNANDLKIYHDGSNSYIDDTGTGDLLIRGSARILLRKAGTTENMIRAEADSYVKLYHDNAEKFETTSTGAIISSTLAGASDLNLQSSDGNEKITLDASGTQRFNVAGSEGMRLTASGLGIGESSPDTLLHLKETINVAYSADNFTLDANALLKLENPSTTGAAFSAIQFRTGSGADLFFGGVQGSGNAGDFVFARQDSTDIELMRIASDGKVGIGTSSVDTKLHVESSSDTFLKVEKTGADNLNLIATGAGSRVRASGALIFDTGGSTERMRIDSSGNLGIANTIPSSFNSQARNLVIGSGSGDAGMTIYSGSGSGDSGNIFFADGTSGDDPTRGGITYKHDDNSMLFRINDSNKMAINTSGNVGIGETNPDASLHITSNTPVIAFDESDANQEYRIGSFGGAFAVYDATDSAYRIVLNGDGKVGIGTSSPAQLLHVQSSSTTNAIIKSTGSSTASSVGAVNNSGTEGKILMFGSGQGAFGSLGSGQMALFSNSAGMSIMNNNANGAIKFSMENGAEKMRITSAGKVGIGTTSPSQLLDIVTSDNAPLMEIRSTVTPNGSKFGGGIVLGLSQANDSGSGQPDTQAGDTLGRIIFEGQGTDFTYNGAEISTVVTVGDGDDNRSNQATALVFKTIGVGGVSSAERMRISSAGTILVGKTAEGTATDGIELNRNDVIVATRNGDAPLLLNRRSSEGDIIVFRKDNTARGSIGSGNGSLYITESTYGGISFSSVGAGDLTPCTPTGGARDNVMSLGQPSARFKDLYLSQGAFIGGTGTANQLDDYEEGTWSVPNGAVNGITFSVTSVAGNTYTKIGRQVTINANMTFGTHVSDGNPTYLGSLPFTPLSGGSFVGKVRTSANITGCCVEINGGESFIRLMKDSGGTYDYVSRAESRDQRMEFTISYLV